MFPVISGVNREVRAFQFKACLNKESGVKELFENGFNCNFKRNFESDQEALAAVRERENWKEKRQIKHIQDLSMNSPGIPDSAHGPATSTCTKFKSESRKCWLENVDQVPNLIPFLRQNPPVDQKVFHLVLA